MQLSGLLELLLTFNLSQFRVQCEVDFGSADAHQLALVALHIAQIPHELFEEIIGVGTNKVNLRGHELVNREDIGHLNVQSRLGLGIEIVELVDVKIGLRVLDRDHCLKLA